MIGLVLRLWFLTVAVDAASPYIERGDAFEHAWHAVALEEPGVPAELLLAIAREETNYRAWKVSKVHDRRGRLKRFCGVTQAAAGTSKARCGELRDLRESYGATVREIQRWRRAARGRIDRALAGYGCGYPMSLRCGSYNGRKVPYPRRVLKRARSFGAEL